MGVLAVKKNPMVGGKIKNATRQWLRHSVTDLDTARFLFKARKYLYVGFMCQQAVEKCLKGIICQEMDITPPRTHNLISLVDLLDGPFDDAQRQLLQSLTEYYLNNRYPDVKADLARQMTAAVAKKLLKDTEGFRTCLEKTYKIPAV